MGHQAERKDKMKGDYDPERRGRMQILIDFFRPFIHFRLTVCVVVMYSGVVSHMRL